MDTRTQFRNLVTNISMPDFDYRNSQFSFQTVFCSSSHFYHCCLCAYQHECLDYISDSGEINEEVYENIIENILKGKCPHVDSVPLAYVTETATNGLNIAAAVGNTEAAIQGNETVSVGIFKMNMCTMAAMKCQYTILTLLGHRNSRFFKALQNEIIHVTKFGDGLFHIKIERLSFLELCVKKNNGPILSSVLKPHRVQNYLEKALAAAFINNVPETRKVLLAYIRSLVIEDYNYTLQKCAVTSIVYNQPEILHLILKCFFTLPLPRSYQKQLMKVCSALQRVECMVVLECFGIHERASPSTDELLALLDEFHDDVKDAVVRILKQTPNISNILSHPKQRDTSMLPQYVHYYFLKTEHCFVKTMFELGIDINESNADGVTPLRCLLEMQKLAPQQLDLNVRAKTELCLDENPDWNVFLLSHSVIDLLIDIDLRLTKRINYRTVKSGEMIMDNQRHTHSGHNDHYSYALNFLLPLFIECGCHFSRDELQKANRMFLNPAERQYIRRCLDTPRPLKIQCRDVLRRHYKGRQIHSFVTTVTIPKTIKDFILLKPTLLLCHKSV